MTETNTTHSKPACAVVQMSKISVCFSCFASLSSIILALSSNSMLVTQLDQPDEEKIGFFLAKLSFLLE